ncbi:MAG: AsmA family protein [Hylemonella sp.]|nr:AsmA family protein [Hylemonella sp.]
MIKPLKYLLYTLLTLVVLVVAGIVILANTIDPNSYKPDVIKLVQDKTQRTLSIPGDISLTFFPRLGADLGRFSLSERRSQEVFAAGEHIQVSVALLPLLSKRIVVDQVVIDGVTANIHRFKNGKSNYDDLVARLMRRVKAKAKDETASAEDEAAAPIELDIGGVALTRASLSYVDDVEQRRFTVSELNLVTGPIASGKPSHVELSAKLQGDKPQLALQLDIKSRFTPDLDQKQQLLQELTASLQGSAAGYNNIRLTLSLPRVDVSPRAIQFDAFTLESSARKVAANPSAPASGEISLSARGKAAVDLEKEDVQAQLAGQFDGSGFDVRLGMKNFKKPAYDFDAQIDRLDIDRYLPPKSAEAKPAPTAEPAVDTVVDLSALQSLNARGKLKIGSMQVMQVKASDLQLAMQAAKGHIEVKPLSAALYDGRVDGALTLDAAKSSRIEVKLTLAQVRLGPLLKDAADLDMLEGKSDVKLDVATEGTTVRGFKKALKGTASVVLQDGALKGINLAEAIRGAKGKLARSEGSAGDGEKTDLTEFSASFQIKQGVAHNEDLSAKTPLLRLGGSGDIDIGESRLDYTVRATVVPTLQGQGGPELDALKGMTVPVRLSGPFTAIGWKVDLGSAVGDRAKQAVEEKKKQAGEEVRKKLDAKKDQAREQIQDRLKGLLRR